MVLSDGADIIGGKKEAPTLVHLVAMSVNKEYGDLEGNSDKVLLELSSAHKMMAMIRVVTREMFLVVFRICSYDRWRYLVWLTIDRNNKFVLTIVCLHLPVDQHTIVITTDIANLDIACLYCT